MHLKRFFSEITLIRNTPSQLFESRGCTVTVDNISKDQCHYQLSTKNSFVWKKHVYVVYDVYIICTIKVVV